MRRPLVFLLLLALGLGGLVSLAWIRAGRDRRDALGREGLAIARVLRGAAVEAGETLVAAEGYLRDRLGAVARRVDGELGRLREPAGPTLQRIAEEERVGRIFLVDADGRPVAWGRTPPPLAGTGGALLSSDEKDQIEWQEAVRAAKRLAPESGELRSEGLRPSVFGSHDRFGVAYGGGTRGTLLLRANADELASLRRRFGLDPILRRVRDLHLVERARVVATDGRVVAGGAADGNAAGLVALPAGRVGEEGSVVTEDGRLRILLPLPVESDAPLLVDLAMRSEGADAGVHTTRRAIVLGAAGVLLAAGLALFVLHRREVAHQRAVARAASRLEEERRLAEMGALAGLVTHEVSNPVSSLRLGIRLLEDADTPAARAEVLATMRQEVARVAERLEGYLRLARGKAPTRVPVTPAILDRVRDRVATEAAGCGVSVRVEADREARDVRGDPLVLEEALTNVMRNAIQASPEGREVVAAWRAGAEGGVRIVIEDEGPGLPADRASLLRVGGDGHSRGHGLGLPLTRRFVQAHGGRLKLEDREGGGARVTIELPGERGDARA